MCGGYRRQRQTAPDLAAAPDGSALDWRQGGVEYPQLNPASLSTIHLQTIRDNLLDCGLAFERMCMSLMGDIRGGMADCFRDWREGHVPYHACHAGGS